MHFIIKNLVTGRSRISLISSSFSALTPTAAFLFISCLFTPVFIFFCFFIPSALADGYPPYWDNSNGAIHFSPVDWPDEGEWTPYTNQQQILYDQRIQDPSNGGTTPQNYVNVSSGEADLTEPSVYWQYDSVNEVLFFRWRVEQIANNYGTGPNTGSYSSSSPWNSAQWTVMIDQNGDGFRDFALHIDGSTGSPAEPVDILRSIYSDTRTQSLDFENNPAIYELFHNPSGFIDASTDILLNFRNIMVPTTSWPNGSSETSWDYGTTRSTDISTPSYNEYFVDYQIPLAMMDASSAGGPSITGDTPISLFFTTANSLNNPLQKDVVFTGSFIPDCIDCCLPFGDIFTLNQGVIPQPIVDWVTAEGCGPVTLTAQVRDALAPPCQGTITTTDFYYYFDRNANGLADDAGSSWTAGPSATNSVDEPSLWTASWDTTGLPKGQYILGVKAQDDQAYTTWSYLTQAEVDIDHPGDYANPTPEPGIADTTWLNTCGENSNITKAVSTLYTTAGNNVDFTLTVNNYTSVDLTLTSITDLLPPGFVYVSTSADPIASTLSPDITSSPLPEPGATGSITWTFSGPTISPGGSETLVFTAQTSTVSGTYTNVAEAVTVEEGTLTSAPVQIGLGEPRLTISKSADKTLASPGDTINYSITYSNDSPVSVTGVTITDPVPTGLTFVSAAGGGSYDSSTGIITWNIGYLGSGEGPYTVGFTVTVSGASSASTTNTATIDSNETTPVDASTSVLINTPLKIAKSGDKILVDPAAAAPGNRVTFTIDYANIGPDALTGVIVTDPIPAGFSFVSSVPGTNCPAGSDVAGTVTWNIPDGTVLAGTTGSCIFTLQADNPFNGDNPTTNTATIDSDSTFPVSASTDIGILQSTCSSPDSYYFHSTEIDTGSDGMQPSADTTAPVSATDNYLVSPQSVTSVEFARFYMDPPASSAATFAGDITVTYWARKVQANPSILVEVYDYDPDTGATILLGSGSDSAGGNITRYDVPVTPSGMLSQGHRLLYIFYVQGSGAQIEFYYDCINYLSGASVCLTPVDMALNKDVDKITALQGETLTYTIRFGNTSPNDVTGAQVVDTLPTGTTYVSATLNGFAAVPCVISGNQYTFDVNSDENLPSPPPPPAAGTITAANSGILVITATIDSPLPFGASPLFNQAELYTEQTDPVSDQAVTNVVGLPLMGIIKSADPTLLKAGETTTFTLLTVNNGNATATNVTVTDTLPEETYFQYKTGSTTLNGAPLGYDPVAGGIFTLNVGSIGPSAVATVTFDMEVIAPVPDGFVKKDNFATGQDDITGPYTSNIVSVTIYNNANLSISKTVALAVDVDNDGVVDPGDTLGYTITVSDIGDSDAVDVQVTDPIPSYTDYSAGSLIYEGVSRTDEDDADPARFDAVNDRTVFDIGDLGSGESRTMSFRVVLDDKLPAGTTQLTNTAWATAGNTATKQATAVSDAVAAPIITLTKSAPSLVPYPLTTLDGNYNNVTIVNVVSTQFIAVGDVISVLGVTAKVTDITGNQLTLDTPVSGNSDEVIPTFRYSLFYNNSGDADATEVTVTDDLASGLDFISADTGGTEYGGTVTWSLGTLAPGDSGSLTVRVRPTATGTYNNNGTISLNELADSDSNTTTTNVGGVTPDKLTTTPSVTNSAAGTQATYQITLTNQLAATAANDVEIVDTLSEGFTYFDNATLIGGTCNVTPSPPSEVIGTDLQNYACIADHTSGAANRPVTGADWADYWVQRGTAGAAWVSGSGYTAGDSQPTWSDCAIPAGGSLSITFDALIAPTVAAGTYQNGVSATSSNLSIMPFDELATTAEDVTVDVPGDFRVRKSVTLNDDPCGVGCSITYTVTVTNVGTSNGTGVTMSDILPAEVTYQSYSTTPAGSTYNNITGVWDVGNLDVGNIAVLDISALINTVTYIENCADLSGSNPADTNRANNHMCAYLGPTPVFLSGFGAGSEDGSVRVRWETASEIDTAGFYLFRMDVSTGEYTRINPELLPSVMTSPGGGSYSLIDNEALPDTWHTYLLVEVTGRDGRIPHGPFTVYAGGGDDNPVHYGEPGFAAGRSSSDSVTGASGRGIVKFIDSGGNLFISDGKSGYGRTGELYSDYRRAARQISPPGRARLAASAARSREVKSSRKNSRGDVLKIFVSEDGLYHVDAESIASLFGISLSRARRRISKYGLRISNMGRPVSYLAAAGGGGLYFYGQGADSPYANENIYWLSRGPGLEMEHAGETPDVVTGNTYDTFTAGLHLEENRYPAVGLFDDPGADYWFWDYIVSGNPGSGSRDFILEVQGVADVPGTARLLVNLHGATNTAAERDHHVSVSLNDNFIGEGYWDGRQPHSFDFTFSQDLLNEGPNIITISGILDRGVPYSTINVDSFDLAYQSPYIARDDKLLFRGEENTAVTVGGFDDPDILLLDISNQRRPKLVAGTILGTAEEGYSVNFRPSSPQSLYLAVSAGAAAAATEILPDKPSRLKSPRNGADYLIITTGELLVAAGELAAYRSNTGLKPKIILLEDILDEFNYGIYSPRAVRDFLGYAHSRWKMRPRYVVLAGDGTFDYKNYQEYGGNLLPPAMVGTPFGLAASDGYYADVDEDYMPEMAIGRLPALTPAELRSVIGKIIAYETQNGGQWEKHVLMAADNPDFGGDFPSDSDEIISLIPPDYSVSRIYLSDYQVNIAREMLKEEINSGAALLNYIGHAGPDVLANEKMLTAKDVGGLANGTRLPVLTAMTCLAGNFSYPGYDSIAEVLLLEENGGAAAIWAPTGFSMNFRSKILNRAFFRARFKKDRVTLGDVVLRALGEYGTSGGAEYMLDIYNIIGDPALRMR